MPSAAGGAVRLLATFFYALEFCCAAIILGSYSYFLSVLANRNLVITRDQKAVEGLSGVAVVYTIFAVVLTCFLGGVKFFAFLAILLDVCFIGAFIALAVLTDSGTESCSGNVVTPIGNGPASSKQGYGQAGFGSGSGETVTYSSSLGFACRLNKACFAVSIIGAVCFLISVLLQVWVSRHHQKEKRFGPSPANNYTSGSGNKRKFWQRKPKTGMQDGYNKDAEMAPMGDATPAGGATLATDSSAPYNHTSSAYHTSGAHSTSSYATGAPAQPATYNTASYTQPADHGGYHTGPVGTSVNPYGYDQGKPTNF